MALVLVFLLLFLFTQRHYFLLCAIGALIINMICPQVYRPLAVIWYGLAHLLGLITSRVLLTIIFLAVVTPVGLVRRLLGADSLKLKIFKDGRETVMDERNHTYIANDIEKPY